MDQELNQNKRLREMFRLLQRSKKQTEKVGIFTSSGLNPRLTAEPPVGANGLAEENAASKAATTNTVSEALQEGGQ